MDAIHAARIPIAAKVAQAPDTIVSWSMTEEPSVIAHRLLIVVLAC
jgi:hypothetical protein